MNSTSRPTDQPGDKGKPIAPDTNKGGQREGVDDHSDETGRRRNRRAQHKDQQNQWRQNPSGCWPSPLPDNEKSKNSA